MNLAKYYFGCFMVFVFDLDDTICDSDGYSKDYILKFFAEHNLPFKQITENARFAEKYFDWDEETALKWYKKYGDKMMLEFPDKNNAIQIINKLFDAGHKIVIATARATDWHFEPEKTTLEWLSKNNLNYHKVYIGRLDKEKICEEENADVFVDDSLSITESVAKHFALANKKGKKVFLSTTKYNKNLEAPQGVERVNNFEEMLKKLNIKY